MKIFRIIVFVLAFTLLSTVVAQASHEKGRMCTTTHAIMVKLLLQHHGQVNVWHGLSLRGKILVRVYLNSDTEYWTTTVQDNENPECTYSIGTRGQKLPFREASL
jgi:hypothetical protein